MLFNEIGINAMNNNIITDTEDNYSKYLAGELTKFYQPNFEHMPDSMMRFEVYGDLLKCKKINMT